jgi:hypothetical protein
LAKRRDTAAPTIVKKPSATAIKFEVAHVRQALQQTVAAGACSPYFDAA